MPFIDTLEASPSPSTQAVSRNDRGQSGRIALGPQDLLSGCFRAYMLLIQLLVPSAELGLHYAQRDIALRENGAGGRN